MVSDPGVFLVWAIVGSDKKTGCCVVRSQCSIGESVDSLCRDGMDMPISFNY